ncbi:MAG: DNA/RNA non-specific endonuclease [Rhodospirillaceae bacterium]|jgi:endonuclease G, mitochondrial|nr:DNA/RNA non-specific endonuclease [Rhodospirillaceae bacterium]MBT5195188.1 DNA/RNA non-specific endonuclease [Rhodospirillaceae bacterium]MBT5896817.1 DNA/RNA non-specific endonuclease [Rhodospirillaceae bacterium]
MREMFILLISALVGTSVMAEPRFYEKQYKSFTVWLDCKENGAVLFRYDLDQDTGSVSRSGSFKVDTTVPASCQPSSGRSYRTATVDPSTGTWDRGHLVPANHMDHSEVAMKETFFVTNILPQQSTFNQAQGAWSRTEVISECYRDVSKLTVWGGVVWGSDASNDFFVDTHELRTPDFWWKVIFRHDTKAYVAWLFPNHKSATSSNADNYLISLNDLKAEIEVVPDFGKLEGSAMAGQTPSPWPVTKSGHQLTCEGQTTSEG